MRRLWSHIVIAASSLLMVGATFATVVTNMNSNIEFEKGQELTFRITAKDDDGNPDKDYEFTDDEAVKETAKIMEKRLATAEISRYKVETSGFDTVKVHDNTYDRRWARQRPFQCAQLWSAAGLIFPECLPASKMEAEGQGGISGKMAQSLPG